MAAKAGYQSFGSFMVEEHVQTMVAKAAQPDYTGPPPPFDTTDLLNGVDEQLPLGKGAHHLFLIDFQVTHAGWHAWQRRCPQAVIETKDRPFDAAEVDISEPWRLWRCVQACV